MLQAIRKKTESLLEAEILHVEAEAAITGLEDSNREIHAQIHEKEQTCQSLRQTVQRRFLSCRSLHAEYSRRQDELEPATLDALTNFHQEASARNMTLDQLDDLIVHAG